MNEITINPDGKWKLYTTTIPDGSKILGTITREGIDTGALVWFEKTGRYAQVNAGVVRAIDGRKVAAALGTLGRQPTAMERGRRVNVYLDAASLVSAKRLGGSVSAGIRLALRRAE